MHAPIPVFSLAALGPPPGPAAEVVFHGPQSAPVPPLPLDRPYRDGFYKVGLCLRGHAQVQVDLETYDVQAGCLVVFSPYGIKQWHYRSPDCAALSVFFTRAFVQAGGGPDPDAFACFAPEARHVVPLPPAEAEALAAQLAAIGQRYQAPHVHREPILRSLLHVLLHDAAPLYGTQQALGQAGRTRAQHIAARFKQLVNAHYATERRLAFYADQLCITPKHLAETVKEATGQPALAWLSEAALLEARVLLQNPALSLSQIADQLHFADASTFGRFFRAHTGLTPAHYLRQLRQP